MYHFFAEHENIFHDYIDIRGGDVNHIKNVIRLKPGDEVLISSGDNYDYHCVIDTIGDDVVRSRITEVNEKGNELPVKVYLFQGLPKSDKMELIIQKMVELGVYEIVPVAMKRSVVKLDDKKAKTKIARWNSISESAAKQSKRSIIPEVSDVLTFRQALEKAKELDMLLLPYECAEGMEYTKGGYFVSVDVLPGCAKRVVELAKEAGCSIITLGKRILRTETAGMMLMSVIMYNMEE